MDFDFRGLTEVQQWLIVMGGWQIGSTNPDGSPAVQPGKRTVKKLIERGLVVECEAIQWVHGLRLCATEYIVPPEVHAAYCQWCAAEASPVVSHPPKSAGSAAG